MRQKMKVDRRSERWIGVVGSEEGIVAIRKIIRIIRLRLFATRAARVGESRIHRATRSCIQVGGVDARVSL